MNIEAIKPKITKIVEKHGLDFVVLFGSQATGRTHSKSDVDVGVISHEKFDILKLMTDLDKVFERDDVTAVDLSKSSPTLMYEVVHDGKLLYEREQASFLKWKFYAIKIWMDTDWLRRLAYKNLIEWAEKIQ